MPMLFVSIYLFDVYSCFIVYFIASSGITWGKVVSLYAVAAGLAVDCVKQSQPALVLTIVDCLGEFVRKTLVTWLKRRGGWVITSLSLQIHQFSAVSSTFLLKTMCTFATIFIAT